MKILKKMISRRMWLIATIAVGIILLLSLASNILGEQRHARQLANRMFYQIEQILNDNQKDLEEVQREYRQTCLQNAETIAYILQNDPELIEDRDELTKIADFTGVDEIHIFDETGTIFAGTHPKHYGMTMDSGEQIGFFKSMLEDKTLELCQDMELNTAENKMMQYSALWSENGEFIVQVGMKPVNVLRFTEKNELSYIFSLLKVNIGADYYAIEATTGEIVGSSRLEHVGKNLSEIGFSLRQLKKEDVGFHANVSGKNSYCVFVRQGDNYIGRIVSNETLYEGIPTEMAELGLCMVFIATLLVWAVTRYMNRKVVNGIYEVNDKLRRITKGNFEEQVQVNSSVEFAELSNHINQLVQKVSALLKKIELERDYDPLTGIYNRRGLDNRLEALFENPEALKYCAILMIDADGLKQINDQYGHEKGDRYLKGISEVLQMIGDKDNVIARQGGDEFVVFLYNYEDEKTLQQAITKLEEIESRQRVKIGQSLEVPLHFSIGYEIDKNPEGFRKMLRSADAKMYEKKRNRKENGV